MYHFNAFISYKHADLDNKVAESIIRDLERYRIPRKIRKSTGIKKIDRVFRDKDELPITSDLNDTISQALINSDFLIVICSTNTKKSTWVEREIEFFLQHHSINNVMTVLADGEPYDVIPKILLSGKKEVTDENGEVKTVDVPYEPLSCDYRLPYKKAKARELPRLVAAIIGCPYDELIDRQRQYKMQRLSAVFAGMMALSVGFAGYMYYSNTQIQKNYLESLRNQSRYLANESFKQFDKYNRIEAMELALEALPKDENDERPVTCEAERAITDASLAYTSQAGTSVNALWNYSMPNRIDSFCLSEDRSKIAILDIGGVVKVCDTESHKELLNLDVYDDTASSIQFFDDNTLIIERLRNVEAYNLNDGSLIWSNGEEHVAYCDSIHKFSDDSILVTDNAGYFTQLSIKDGSILKTYPVIEILEDRKKASNGEDAENDFIYISLYNCTLSEDCRKIAFTASDSSELSNEIKTINEYNFDTNELVSVPYENEKVMKIRYFGDNIYLSCNPDDSDMNSKYLQYTYVTDSRNVIRCLSSGDLSQKWEDELINTDVTINYDFLPMVNGTIAYYEGNAAKVWNNDTGELVNEYTFNDAAVNISDLDGNGEPFFITFGGYTATKSTSDGQNGVYLIKRFAEDIEDADYGLLTYVRPYNSREIICYGMEVHDEAWNRIDGDEVINMESKSSYLDDDVFAIIASDGADGTALYSYDPNSKKYYGKAVIDKEKKPYYFEIIGSFNNKIYIVSDDYDGALKLFDVDASTLEISDEVLDEDYGFIDLLCLMTGDKLIYGKYPDYEHCMLVVRNLLTKEEETIDIPQELYSSIVYDEGSQVGFLCGGSNVLFDLTDKSVVPVTFDEDWGATYKACISSDGKTIAVTNNEDIKLINNKGETVSEIPCRNLTPLGFTFFKNEEAEEVFIVAYGNGTLLRYSIASGELIGTTDLTTYAGTFYDATFKHTDGDKYLYVSTGDVMDVIDTDAWYEIICMDNCMANHDPTDTFFTYSYQNKAAESYVGYFEHYSIEDLIGKTREILGDYELSEEKKSMYGIAD